MHKSTTRNQAYSFPTSSKGTESLVPDRGRVCKHIIEVYDLRPSCTHTVSNIKCELGDERPQLSLY
jgi:hypothetical protein